MPVSVVVGGQFGSEGKGKVAHFLAREMNAAAAVRVGGPNSGHTVVTPSGEAIVFRQLPTAATLAEPLCVIAAGSYVDTELLLAEMKLAGLPPNRLVVDPHAILISEQDLSREAESGLRERIGSTLSGTGAAVCRRIERDPDTSLARDDPRLEPYLRSVIPLLRGLLEHGRRVIVEGTQGFGLSLLHGEDYPYVTSRDTTAAACISEVGLSPLDVDDVVLVIRAFPIRVPGASGRLPAEIDWRTLTAESGAEREIVEYTSVTRGVRRVARFDPEVVIRAIQANRPTRIVMNHLDYADWEAGKRGVATERVIAFVRTVSEEIERGIEYYGLSPSTILPAGAAALGMRRPMNLAAPASERGA